MNKAQQENFEKWAQGREDSVELRRAAYRGYSAACADNEERTRKLVEALEQIENRTASAEPAPIGAHVSINLIASAALKAYRGE